MKHGQRKYEGTIRLQGIGVVEGIKAKNIVIGDILVWNFGETSKVIAIEFSKTGKTLIITTEYVNYSGEVETFERRLNAERIVVVKELNPVVEVEKIEEVEDFEVGYKNQKIKDSCNNKNVTGGIEMLAVGFYDSYMSGKLICSVEKDVQEGVNRGYRQPDRYFKITEIFYDTQDDGEYLSGKEIEEVLGRRISTWDSVGVTHLFESYIIPITEDEKDILLKFLNNRVNEKEQVVLNLINGWKDVSAEDREAYLQNTMQKIDSLKTKQSEMRELFLKEIRLYVEFLKERAKKEGKKQLYFKNLVPCNDYKEECNWDLLCRYIDEEGNGIVIREHTY